MSEFSSIDNISNKTKSFWSRPEGKTGVLFIVAAIAAIAFLIVPNIAAIVGFASSTVSYTHLTLPTICSV